MSLSLHSASVPVLVHYLDRLQATLRLAQAHGQRAGRAETELLGARLADGMFPLAQQVCTACSFALRTCCPLLGMAEPALPGGDRSFAQLHERIAGTLQFLHELPAERLAAAENVKVSATAGFVVKEFEGADYVSGYALPNFFFHLSMVHAILRREGVAIGKQDFDGHHRYPAGFSFAERGQVPLPLGEAQGEGHEVRMTEQVSITVHDELMRDATQVVDEGLGASNEAAAPLHDVQPLCCFARRADGTVVGGAVGRTWGACCELQQLWVDPAQRRGGLGTRLVKAFEARAEARGCTTFYLDTFSFQAKPFYERLGYEARLEVAGFAPDIAKYTMLRTSEPR